MYDPQYRNLPISTEARMDWGTPLVSRTTRWIRAKPMRKFEGDPPPLRENSPPDVLCTTQLAYCTETENAITLSSDCQNVDFSDKFQTFSGGDAPYPNYSVPPRPIPRGGIPPRSQPPSVLNPCLSLCHSYNVICRHLQRIRSKTVGYI